MAFYTVSCAPDEFASSIKSAGRYRAEVLGQGYGESDVKGTPFFFLVLRILVRYTETGEPQPCPQYEREYRQYLGSETGAHILRGDLTTLGVEVGNLAQLDPATPGHISLVGRHIDVCCEMEGYKGKPRERWGIPRARKKLDGTALRSLSDQFGHIFRRGGDSAKPPSANDDNPN